MNISHAGSQPSAYEQWWSVNNAMTMCAVLLLFAFFVLSLSGYLLGKDTGDRDGGPIRGEGRRSD